MHLHMFNSGSPNRPPRQGLHQQNYNGSAIESRRSGTAVADVQVADETQESSL